MITKEAFVAALGHIKGPKSRWQWKQEESGGVLNLDLSQMDYLSDQLELLCAAIPDPHGYIEKWLFETLEPLPQPDGSAVTVPWEAPGTLYDLLVREAATLPEEKLPLLELPMVGEVSHRAIRAVDYFNYFDAVLDYVKRHDVVIHITEEKKEDKLLLGLGLYQRLCALSDEGKTESAGKKTIVEFSVDPGLEKKFRDLIAPTGFTLEQMAEMFLCWCAHYPDDAYRWLEQEKEVEGKGWTKK